MITKQKGFAHLQLLAAIIAVMSFVAFAAYRVGQIQSNNNKTSSTDDITTVQEIKTVESEEQEEVVIPDEVKEAESVPVEKADPEPVEQKVSEPAPEEKKKSDKRWIKMTKISATQNGSVIDVVSKLPETLTGTCGFKLWQDGYEKVYSTSSISNSTDCIGQLDISSLSTLTGWTLFAWFDSSDGTVSASQPEEPITITP